MEIKLGLCNLRHTWKNRGKKIPFFHIDSGGGIKPGSNFINRETRFYLFGYWICELKYRKKIK